MVMRSETEIRKERENLTKAISKNPQGSAMAVLKAKIVMLTWILKEEENDWVLNINFKKGELEIFGISSEQRKQFDGKKVKVSIEVIEWVKFVMNVPK